jgi:hypothetical protein
MLSWSTIVYGAVLSAAGAALLVFALRRDRRYDVLAAAALAGGLGPLAWNAILHRVGGSEFFVDAPVSVLPASWQDTGSGVFALATAAVLLGLGPLRTVQSRRTVEAAIACALAAFLVDVYLY